MVLGWLHRKSSDQALSGSERGQKRSADSEDLLPATTPAVKLHKDASGDIATAATVTAELPADTTEILPAAAIAVPQPESAVMLSKLAVLEEALVKVTTDLAATQSELAATKDSFSAQLKEQERNSVARENVIKDTHRQQVARLESTVEFLNQRVRSKNMVMHGIPDTAALSRPAALEHFVKSRVDDATRGREPSISHAITSVTHMGRPSEGNRSVLVEYTTSQAKHKAYALSQELRRNGFHLSDELTPKQLQTQKDMEPDVTALRSKGYRPWFRRGSLWYSNRGVPRQCRRGEAI